MNLKPNCFEKTKEAWGIFSFFSSTNVETKNAMAIKEGRNAIGFDIELKYVEMGNKRTEIIKSQPSLFF